MIVWDPMPVATTHHAPCTPPNLTPRTTHTLASPQPHPSTQPPRAASPTFLPLARMALFSFCAAGPSVLVATCSGCAAAVAMPWVHWVHCTPQAGWKATSEEAVRNHDRCTRLRPCLAALPAHPNNPPTHPSTPSINQSINHRLTATHCNPNPPTCVSGSSS